MKSLSRRKVLRGMLNGGSVAVALPLLNCFLNDNGTAFASGKPLPVRFGTWFWGLGIDKKVFVPTTYGPNFELPEEISALNKVREHINLFTNLQAYRDGAPDICHYTGWVIARSGSVPEAQGDKPGQTLDVSVANQIGRTTRFKTLTATATGDPRTSVSYENSVSSNSSEFSPVAFYKRLFGPDFVDPNAETFEPNPRVMLRKSVLSGVMDDIRAMNKSVGAEDKARLDQYFTGIRHLERQVDQQLTKPEPLAACHFVAQPEEDPKIGSDTELVGMRHKLMTDLMVMAVACDQTRVFNMTYSSAQANTTKAGYYNPHHTTTHEEAIDDALGYQPTASWYLRRSMESWAYFIESFANVKEGAGSLLDNVLIYASTDHGLARTHSLTDMPAFTAGRAGGRIKTGLHVDGKGEAVTRVGYTAMKVMGLEQRSWGTKSNTTAKEFSEILV